MAKKLRRKIYIVDAISDESYLKFSKKLAVLESQGLSQIEIELFSSGGDAYSALAFSSRIRQCKCAIKINAHGFVASAAVLVLASGHLRTMAKEAWVMVHEDSGKVSGSVTEMVKAAGHLDLLEDQWAQLLAERSLASAEEWRLLHNETRYLSAKQCLDLGLIDEVV